MNIRYLGQCGFEISADGITIAIDPVLNDIADENGKTFRCYPPVCKPEELKVDYIFCTHEHIDHMALPTLLPIAREYPGTTFIVPKGIKNMLEESEISEDRIIGISDDETIYLADEKIKVRGVATAHPVHYLNDDGEDCTLAYAIEIAGEQLVHLGDTYLTDRLLSSLEKLGRIDIFMPPINGRSEEREARGIIGNLSYREAAELAVKLNAELTIPTHFDMIEGNTEDPKLFAEELLRLKPDAKYMIPVI